MATDILLANMALLELGKDPITSFDEGTEEANWISLIFPEVIEECLADGPWSFATKRYELALLDSKPAYGFAYWYELPNDFITLLLINDDRIDWHANSIEDHKLLINLSSVKIKYVYRNTNVGAWPAYFKKAFIKWLAYRLCYLVRADLNLRRSLWQEYAIERDIGLAIDGQQGSHDRIQFDEFIEDR